MRMLKLKDAITKKKTTTVTTKDALYAWTCMGCGRVFKMNPLYNGQQPARMTGIFDRVSGYDGNMFHAYVCSFKCADAVMQGAWKDVDDYKCFVKEGASLLRCSVEINAKTMDREQIIEEWEDQPSAPTHFRAENAPIEDTSLNDVISHLREALVANNPHHQPSRDTYDTDRAYYNGMAHVIKKLECIVEQGIKPEDGSDV